MGKYTFVEKLGKGPTCDVFLAKENEGLGRTVVVKKLRDDALAHAARRDAFYQSARLWSAVQHECVVTLLDLDPSLGTVSYEHYPTTIARALREDAEPPQQFLRTFEQVVSGLNCLHEFGLLHLNIKPSNLLIDSTGQPNLADGHCVRASQPGEIPRPVGTQKYLAPEIIDTSLGRLGPAADVYSLTMVMLEYLAGPQFQQLFSWKEGDSNDDRNWLRWHTDLNHPLPSLEERIPDLSPDLARILERALQKNPLQRYHTASELHNELLQLAHRQSANVQPTLSSVTPVPQPSVPVAGQPAVPAAQPKLGDIVERPQAPVVLRFVGLGGEMVGVNSDFFTLGNMADCEVLLPGEFTTVANVKLRFSRGAEGWRVSAADGLQYFVNQTPARGLVSLRSGDVVRVAPGGNGVQFTIMHQGAESLTKLAAKYLSQPASAPRQPESPSLSHSNTSAAPAAPKVFAPAPPSRSVAPSAPSARAKPATPVKLSAAPTPPRSPSKPSRTASEARQPSKLTSLRNYKQWDKSTKNWAFTIVALVVMGAIITLWPSSPESPTPPVGSPSPEAQPAEGESTESG